MIRLTVPSLVVALMATATAVAISQAVSEELRAQAEDQFTSAWADASEHGLPLEENVLRGVRQKLQTASWLTPTSAATYQQLAGMFMVPVSRDGRVGNDPRAAYSALRVAATYLPTSPYVWSAMALSADGIAQADSGKLGDVQTAMRTAAKLGPWERDVNSMVVELGLANWLVLDAKTKPVVVDAIARLASAYPEDVMTIVAKRGNVEVVCKAPQLSSNKACIVTGDEQR